MKIKRLVIDGSAAWKLDAVLRGGVTSVRYRDPGEVVRAVGAVLLFSPYLNISPPRRKVYAEVATDGCEYRVHVEAGLLTATDVEGEDRTDEYRALMCRSPEEDRILIFDGRGEDTLGRYLKDDKFFVPGEFSRITCGMGATRSFRTELKRYMTVRSLSPDESDPVTRFLDAARFWDGFGKIRDFSYEGKPLIIKKAEGEILRELIRQSGTTERQMMIIER